MHFIKNMFRGRIGRENYFVGQAIAIILAFGAPAFLVALIPGIPEWAVGWTFFLSILVALVLSTSVITRRIHDLDWKMSSGNVILFSFIVPFIPIVNIIFALKFIFEKGTPGSK